MKGLTDGRMGCEEFDLGYASWRTVLEKEAEGLGVGRLKRYRSLYIDFVCLQTRQHVDYQSTDFVGWLWLFNFGFSVDDLISWISMTALGKDSLAICAHYVLCTSISRDWGKIRAALIETLFFVY